MNKVKADVDFSFGIVPASWPVCFVPGCLMTETCLNHLVAFTFPADEHGDQPSTQLPCTTGSAGNTRR